MDNGYLKYFLLSEKGQISLKERETGTTVTGIKQSELRLVPIDIPKIEVQKNISSILASIDKKIQLNIQTNNTLESIAQSIFKEWFVEFNFPGSTGEMKKSELGFIPKKWKIVSFEDELLAERGLSYKGAGLTNESGVPMHNLNSVFEGGGYKADGIKFYKGDFKERHKIHPGDLIIANTEQGHKYLLIGFPAIVPSYYGDISIFSHHIYTLKPKQDSYLTSSFLYHLLLNPVIRDQVVGFANGTTVNMLKIEGLQKPIFALPPKSIVTQFSEMHSSVLKKIEANLIENKTLAMLRDTLLPKTDER